MISNPVSGWMLVRERFLSFSTLSDLLIVSATAQMEYILHMDYFEERNLVLLKISLAFQGILYDKRCS